MSVRPAVCLPLVLSAVAMTQGGAQEVTPAPPRGYRLGASAGWVYTWENPYQVAGFGAGIDASAGQFVGSNWLIGAGGRIAQHYVLADSLLGDLRIAGGFVELRRYGRQPATAGVSVRSFTGARVGYVYAWGPGAGVRGGGGEIAGIAGADVQFSPLRILEVSVQQVFQIVDGRFGGQFGIHVGLALRFGVR